MRRRPWRQFAYRLALATGRVNVDAMLDEISWPQLLEWMQFAALEPWGAIQDDRRAGTVAAVTANVHRDPRRRPAPYQPRDFMPILRDNSRPRRHGPTEAGWARLKRLVRESYD